MKKPPAVQQPPGAMNRRAARTGRAAVSSSSLFNRSSKPIERDHTHKVRPMPYYTEQPQEVKRRPAGLFLLPYTMEALRERRITARQAILLGHVDHWINHRDKDKRTPSRVFRIDFLRSILALKDTRQSLRKLILDLEAKRPPLLKARKLDRQRWELKTKPRDRDRHGYLYVAPPIRKGFEAGELTPMHAILLGEVASFTRGGKLCYVTNKHFENRLGVSKNRVVKLIGEVVDRGWLLSQLMTHDDLGDVLARHNGCAGFKRRGGRTSRLLWPTDWRLYSGTTDWAVLPEEIEWPEDDEDGGDDEEDGVEDEDDEQ